MKFFKDSKNIYILPAMLINRDHYYEWDLIYMDIEFRWLNFGIRIPIKKEDI